mgnify:CR=1 FL=1
MKITIDNQEITIIDGETILQAARRNGIQIPSMCYAEGREHRAGCMVCTVKDVATGRMITSCSVKPTEGMQIDTRSEDVVRHRTMALELLLSDHRADCEISPTLTTSPNMPLISSILSALATTQLK